MTIRLSDFNYDLPPDRIPDSPNSDRSSSRLLLFDGERDEITHHYFFDLPELLEPGITLVVNDTHVIRGRIILKKSTGGRVEFLLLEPVAPSGDPAVALAASGSTTWKCVVGGLKKLRSGDRPTGTFQTSDGTVASITATLLPGEAGESLVEFSWEPAAIPFADVLSGIGHVPLPPYMNREDRPADAENYQTVYSRSPGAVAAPTAGLHFTPEVLSQLEKNGVRSLSVTLHVGAGTFAPVKVDYAEDHPMHSERIVVTHDQLRALIEAQVRRRDEQKGVVMVGTTSIRTVESLYWIGVQLLRNESQERGGEFILEQWTARNLIDSEVMLPSVEESLNRLLEQGVSLGLDPIIARTHLMIVPGYRFMTCDGLITNFHQPGSTLILLVAAFVGADAQRMIYEEALAGDYRFLSYGDSSLLVGRRAIGTVLRRSGR